MREHAARLPHSHRGPERKSPQSPESAEIHAEILSRNAEQVARIESRDRDAMVWSERFAETITGITGSMWFVVIHVIWFSAWLVLNLASPVAWDPPPFGVMTLVVSLEAIFLSVFVLISQNRQAQAADRRSKVDLQVNMMTEQELTKLLELVRDIHDHLDTGRRHDPELEAMQEHTSVEKIAEEVQAAEESGENTPINGTED